MKAKTKKSIAQLKAAPAVVAPPPQELKLAASETGRKIDLACGQNPREGFEGIDLWPGAAIVHDLFKYPWPIADNSCDELNCSHFIEHIPMIEVDQFGNQVPYGQGQDALLRHFDEVYRILKPGAWITVVTPSARNNRAFQDPTHRRFIVAETFLYFSKQWREQNKLDHYKTVCDFDLDVNPTIPVELSAMVAEVQNQRMNNFWNVTVDWYAKLRKRV